MSKWGRKQKRQATTDMDGAVLKIKQTKTNTAGCEISWKQTLSQPHKAPASAATTVTCLALICHSEGAQCIGVRFGIRLQLLHKNSCSSKGKNCSTLLDSDKMIHCWYLPVHVRTTQKWLYVTGISLAQSSKGTAALVNHTHCLYMYKCNHICVHICTYIVYLYTDICLHE